MPKKQAWSDGTAIVSAVTVTVADMTGYGANLQGGTLTLNGPIKVNVGGAVSDDGARIESYGGDLTVLGSINVTLEAGADYGLFLYSDGGGLSDSGTIQVSVAGSCGGDGAHIGSYADMTISGTLNVRVGGTALDGLALVAMDSNPALFFSEGGSVTDTAGITVQVTGAVHDGLYLQGEESLTVANVKVTLADVADGTGLYAEADNGSLKVSSANVVANAGSAKAYGVNLLSKFAAINASGINVSMTGQAGNGVYVQAESTASVSGISAKISAAVAGEGIYVDAAGALTASSLPATLKSTTGPGIYLQGRGPSINGPLSAAVTGA
jgi:hypothetical protein